MSDTSDVPIFEFQVPDNAQSIILRASIQVLDEYPIRVRIAFNNTPDLVYLTLTDAQASTLSAALIRRARQNAQTIKAIKAPQIKQQRGGNEQEARRRNG
jgi:hypothetical protein